MLSRHLPNGRGTAARYLELFEVPRAEWTIPGADPGAAYLKLRESKRSESIQLTEDVDYLVLIIEQEPLPKLKALAMSRINELKAA